jgi:hypothetical protein
VRRHRYAPARRRRCRVCAARRAAALRTRGPFVRAARRADALLAEEERRLAAVFACRDSAFREAALRPSRFNAETIARDRFREVLRDRPAARRADCALRFVVDFALAGGGGRATPARLAFDKPMAMACLVERAPCLPWRMCSISSWTNSPACVVGAFPALLSLRARSIVFCSGMIGDSVWMSKEPTHERVLNGALKRDDTRRDPGETDRFQAKANASTPEVRKVRALCAGAATTILTSSR